MTEADHLTDDRPAGFIEWGHELMAYWTPDGRSIEEIWAEVEPALVADNDDEIPF